MNKEAGLLKPFQGVCATEEVGENREEDAGGEVSPKAVREGAATEEQQAESGRSEAVYNPANLDIFRHSGRHCTPFENPREIAGILGCQPEDLRTHSSPEKTEAIDTGHFRWHGNVTIDIRDITAAVDIEITLLENLDEEGGTFSALHIVAKLVPRLCQILHEEGRHSALALKSELWDQNDGKQLDLQKSHTHQLKQGRVNFIQYLVKEEEVEACSSGSVNLVLKARLYTYPMDTQ